MNIGFISYGLPFRWWDNTFIAHNRIFARVIIELSKHTNHKLFVFARSPHAMLRNRLKYYNVKICDFYFGTRLAEISKLDVLIIFCGPHTPASPNSPTELMVRTLAAFSGRAVFVTCDYMLQFDFDIKRYGPWVSDISEHALFDNKDWLYVLHGGFDHHFKTQAAQKKMLDILPAEKFLSVPLNMSGIPPADKIKFKPAEPPAVDLLYCGAYRQNRLEYFKKYFCTPKAKRWHISSTQGQKFRSMPGMQARVRAHYESNIWKFLNLSWAQIILGDKVDSKCASTPLPTRFWEACAAQVPVFFDETCRIWADKTYGDCENTEYTNGPEELAAFIDELKSNPDYRYSKIDMQNKLIECFDPWKDWKIERWLR